MLTPTHVAHPLDGSIMMEKCYPYYPLDVQSPPLVINETSQLGGNFKATVRFLEREETTEGTAIELRKLAMKVEGQEVEKVVWHFLYPGWPDFGAIEEDSVDSLLALMVLSREKNTSTDNPRVVHCSAGVGRSGTFIALEFLVGELQRGAWERWDDSTEKDKDPVFETVNQLRIQRRTMVQAQEQFSLLYGVLRKLWNEKYGVTPEAGETAPENGLQEPPAKVVKRDPGADGSVFE